MDKIRVDGMRFLDEYGRERIFSGMNVVDKKDFDEKNPGYGYKADNFPFEEFRARGYDIIRLGFTWSAMEPQPGHYAYLPSLAYRVQKSAIQSIDQSA